MNVEKRKLHEYIDKYVAMVARTCYVTEDKAAQAIYEVFMNNAVDIAEMVGAEMKKEDET